MPAAFASLRCPGGSTATIQQPHWMICAVNAGRGSLCTAGRHFPLTAGAILCIPPECPCTIDAESDLSLLTAVSADFIIAQEAEPLLFQDDADASFLHLMRLTCRTCMDLHRASGSMTDALYDSMQYMLLSWRQTAKSDHVKRLSALLEENFSNPEYSISDAIETMPFCKDHIRRLFKKETGITPIAYLTELRLEHARRLLRQQMHTRRSVAEISYMCGFYDPRYFSRQFKRATGMTPREYAQKYAPEENR